MGAHSALVSQYVACRFNIEVQHYCCGLKILILNRSGLQIQTNGTARTSAGSALEVNSISTIFAKEGQITSKEEVIYRSNEITPDQTALLEKPNSSQYQSERELSSGKDTKISENNKKSDEKKSETAEGLIAEMAAVDERERSLAGKPGYNEAYNAKAALADRIGEVVGDLPTNDLLRIHKEAKKRGMHAIEAHVEGELLKRRDGNIEREKAQREVEQIASQLDKGNTPKNDVLIQRIADMAEEAEAALESGSLTEEERVRQQARFDVADAWIDNNVRGQKADRAKPVTKKEARLRDAIVDLLRKAGIEVVTESEEGQRVLDMANGRGVTLNKAQKRTLETARLNQQEEGTKGTVVSSDDGAKVLKNLDTLINK